MRSRIKGKSEFSHFPFILHLHKRTITIAMSHPSSGSAGGCICICSSRISISVVCIVYVWQQSLSQFTYNDDVGVSIKNAGGRENGIIYLCTYTYIYVEERKDKVVGRSGCLLGDGTS